MASTPTSAPSERVTTPTSSQRIDSVVEPQNQREVGGRSTSQSVQYSSHNPMSRALASRIPNTQQPPQQRSWSSTSGLDPSYSLAGLPWPSHSPASLTMPQQPAPPPGRARLPPVPDSFTMTGNFGAEGYTPGPSRIPTPPRAITGRPRSYAERPSSPNIADGLLRPNTATGAQRRSSGKDEFDGPVQLLDTTVEVHAQLSDDQLTVPLTSLLSHEQQYVSAAVNDCLSRCAFDFVAKWQFPIPVEPGKPTVRSPGDREWSEWRHLLQRLATKRRIPMRVLWQQRIREFVPRLNTTHVEPMRSGRSPSEQLMDDWAVLQFISAGFHVAQMLRDGPGMNFLYSLYRRTDAIIRQRADPTYAAAMGQLENTRMQLENTRI